MNFGEMLEILKDGKHRAYRANWNGILNEPDWFKHPKIGEYVPSMYIYCELGKSIPFENLGEPIKSWLGVNMDVQSHMNLVCKDQSFNYTKVMVGWGPSQIDMALDDWEICWQDIKLKVTQDEIIPGPVIRTKEEMDKFLDEEQKVKILPVEFAPKGEGITYIQVKSRKEIDISEEDWAKKAEEVLNDPEIEKRFDLNMDPEVLKEFHKSQALDQERLLKPLYDKDPSMFVMQPYAVLHDKLQKEKILWIDSDSKLVRAKLASDLFGGDFKDSGSRYLDLFLKQDDVIIVFGKGLKKEIQNQITDMGLTNKRLLSIEVKIEDIPLMKENIIKQLSEVWKDG